MTIGLQQKEKQKAARENLVRTMRQVVGELERMGYSRLAQSSTYTLSTEAVVRGYSPDERKELWKRFDRTAKGWESRFEQGAAQALEADRGEILAIVNQSVKSSLKRKASIDWKKVLKTIQEYLEEASAENWREVFAPLIVGIVGQQGEAWSVRLGVQFNLQNLRSRDWFNQYLLHFADPINDTTEREIAQILNRAQAEGSSGAQVMRQLDDLFGRYISGMSPDDPEYEWYTERTPPFRRETIARTETVRASNAGTDGLFKDWGVKKKEWLSTKDERTRTYDTGEYDHLEADGQVVGIDDEFEVSGEQLKYPGDPTSSPGNVINCRCTEIPVIEEGERLEPMPESEAEPAAEEPGPAGKPVSEALKVSSTARTLGSKLKVALEVIDQVHGDGDLPKIPIEEDMNKEQFGFFMPDVQGQRESISVSIYGNHPEVTTLHEIGHFLDWETLGVAKQFASHDPSLTGEWSQAVKNSQAFKLLQDMAANPNKYGEEVSSGALTYTRTPSKQHIQYLTSPHELWARSYAQYISEKSESPVLMEQLEKLLEEKLYHSGQWEHEDFEPIREAIDELFKTKGWIQ